MRKLFSPREKFLAVDVGISGSRGFLVELSGDRVLKLRKHWRNFDLRQLKKISNKSGRGTRTVLALNFPLALEAVVSVAAQRENPGTFMGETELENIFVEAVQKNFNVCRERAAKALGAPELGVVLFSVRIVDLKFDCSAVVNIQAQKPKQIEAIMEMIFVHREAFGEMNFLMHNSPNVFFTESVAAQIFALRKIKGMEAINFLASAGTGNYLFVPWMENDFESLKRHAIGWPADWPHQVLSAIWKLDSETSGKVYRKYLIRNVSAGLQKHLNGVFGPFVNNLSLRLKSKAPKGGFYVGATIPPPFLKNGLELASADVVVPVLLEKTGLALDPRWPLGASETVQLIGLILKSCRNGNFGLNKKIWRRLHWLNFSNMP